MPTLLSYDGTTFASIDIAVGLPHGNDGPYVSTPSLRQRTNQPPSQEYTTWGERTLPFIVTPTDGVGDAGFRANVYRYLAPFGGLRVLTATHDNGSTAIETLANVTSLQKRQDNLFEGTFLIPDPIWRTSTTTTDTSSPTTNGGEFKALPSISITPTSSTVKRRVVTITDNTGRGLSNYPVLLSFNSTAGGAGAAASENYIAYISGRSVPIHVTSPDSAATRIWLRTDIPANGSVDIYVYYGSSVTNTLAGSGATSPFLAGGLDLATSSNTSWTWSVSTTPGSEIGCYNFSIQPVATGVWRPGKLGLTQENTSYGISEEAGNQLILYIEDDGSAANDADCMICVLGVNATSQITGLSRRLQSTVQLGGILRSFVKYRTANQNSWTTVSLEELDSTVAEPPQDGGTDTGAITITNAVEVAIGIEPKEAQPSGILTLSGAMTIALSQTPTVSIAAEATARIINATLTNATNGHAIIFTDVYLDNVALTIDCLNKHITVASGTWFGDIVFSDPDDWFALAVGANSWSWSAGTYTTSFEFADRYLI